MSGCTGEFCWDGASCSVSRAAGRNATPPGSARSGSCSVVRMSELRRGDGSLERDRLRLCICERYREGPSSISLNSLGS